MNIEFLEIARKAVNADEIYLIEDIQTLWSGYGKIMRYGLHGGDCDQIVIKHVQLPDKAHHPRGWSTDYSHQRKIRSYQVESNWYRDWSNLCDDLCRVPQCLKLKADNEEFLMVLEDLNMAGFPLRKDSVSIEEMQLCLRWLANFHAVFMGCEPAGLWQVGTYWHLETRPDELAVLQDSDLKAAAKLIDQTLCSAQYQTFVHGDAKLANFCFSESGEQVAGVDFQYTGGGCGIKDVAYFIGSCLYEEDCERYQVTLLDYYFSQLEIALAKNKKNIDFNEVEKEWRCLYPFAWTDFHRFLKGWSPGHWKIHSYSERLARDVVAQLNSEST